MGGALTPAEVLQVRTIAGLTVHAEQMQAAVLRGEPVDTEQLTRLSNTLVRAISGLRRGRAARKPPPSTPVLDALRARQSA